MTEKILLRVNSNTYEVVDSMLLWYKGSLFRICLRKDRIYSKLINPGKWKEMGFLFCIVGVNIEKV